MAANANSRERGTGPWSTHAQHHANAQLVRRSYCVCQWQLLLPHLLHAVRMRVALFQRGLTARSSRSTTLPRHVDARTHEAQLKRKGSPNSLLAWSRSYSDLRLIVKTTTQQQPTRGREPQRVSGVGVESFAARECVGSKRQRRNSERRGRRAARAESRAGGKGRVVDS